MNEYLAKVSAPVRYLILFILASFFMALVAIQFIMPLNEDTKKKEEQLLQANTRYAALQTFATRNQDYEALLKIQNLKVSEAKKRLPDVLTIPELVAEYSKLALVNGIILESLKPPTEVKPDKGGAFAVPLKMTLSGDYFKLVEFLQQVELGTRFTTLQGVNFSADGKGTLKMDADFVVYALKNPKPAASKAKAPAAKPVAAK